MCMLTYYIPLEHVAQLAMGKETYLLAVYLAKHVKARSQIQNLATNSKTAFHEPSCLTTCRPVISILIFAQSVQGDSTKFYALQLVAWLTLLERVCLSLLTLTARDITSYVSKSDGFRWHPVTNGWTTRVMTSRINYQLLIMMKGQMCFHASPVMAWGKCYATETAFYCWTTV